MNICTYVSSVALSATIVLGMWWSVVMWTVTVTMV